MEHKAEHMMQVNFHPFPVLQTPRLLLRQMNEGDKHEMFLLRSNKELMKYICRPRPETEDEVLPFLHKIRDRAAANEGIAWGITLKGAPAIIGNISFHEIIKEHYRAEVGYMMFQAYHGKGIMDEALKAVLDYGFNVMGLHSVEAKLSPDNTASRKLLENNNFIREAWYKEDFFWEGEFLDTFVYSLINPGKNILR